MNHFYGLFCMILSSTEASSNEISVLRRTREIAKTDVVSLTFCESHLPAEDKMGKKTLEKVHTYAELKDDPRASLPDSFTVCSTIMTTGCQSPEWLMVLNILDKNRDQFLAPHLHHGDIESRLNIWFRHRNTQVLAGKVPSWFSNQWARS